MPHTQIVQEFFVGIKGNAKLKIGDEIYSFTMGNITAIPKHTDHYVINDTEEDFHFYVIWWDENITQVFLKEHADIGDTL